MTAELQFWADLRKSLVCVFVLMVFITAPPFVPLVVSAGAHVLRAMSFRDFSQRSRY